MNCKNHNEKDAGGACVYCGELFCEECLVDINGKKYCKEHVVNIINDMGATKDNTKISTTNNTDIVIQKQEVKKINKDLSVKSELCKKDKGIILSSPSNFPNDLRKLNILYFVFIPILILITKNDIGINLSFLLGIAAAFLVINLIMPFKLNKLKSMRFDMLASFSKDEISNIITLPLTKLNMEVENLSDYIRVTHNKIQYDIFLDFETNTFRIWPQKSLVGRLLAGRVYTSLYKKAILSMPIIVHTVQAEINKKVNSKSEKIDINEVCNFEEIYKKAHTNNKTIKDLFKFAACAITVLILFNIIDKQLINGIGNKSNDTKTTKTIAASNNANKPRSDSDYINFIKSSYLDDHPEATIEDVLNRSYINTNWKYFDSESGEKTVEFTGRIKQELFTENVLIQFLISNDNKSFKAVYVEWGENTVYDDPMAIAIYFNLLYTDSKVNKKMPTDTTQQTKVEDKANTSQQSSTNEDIKNAMDFFRITIGKLTTLLGNDYIFPNDYIDGGKYVYYEGMPFIFFISDDGSNLNDSVISNITIQEGGWVTDKLQVGMDFNTLGKIRNIDIVPEISEMTGQYCYNFYISNAHWITFYADTIDGPTTEAFLGCDL